LEILNQWSARAAAEGRTVVVAGHHPFDALEDRSAIGELISLRRIATYISAHTHWGQYFTHTDADGYSWLEPNLGSIIDYSSEFAMLALGFNAGKTFVRMTRTTTSSFAVGEHSDLGIVCKDAWFARPDDDDFYTRYMATTSPNPQPVDTLYYSTMLAAL